MSIFDQPDSAHSQELLRRIYKKPTMPDGLGAKDRFVARQLRCSEKTVERIRLGHTSKNPSQRVHGGIQRMWDRMEAKSSDHVSTLREQIDDMRGQIDEADAASTRAAIADFLITLSDTLDRYLQKEIE